MADTATVVIDPGHGGSQTLGGSSPNNATGPNGLLEKELTLDLARRVAQSLQGRARVLLTRNSDTNLSLTGRAAIARDNHADLFLSIHFNGFSDPTVDGTEVWISREPNAQSRALAEAVLAQLTAVTGVRNRGIREQDFGVLLPSRHAPNTAACLLETAFLTNPAQARRLESTEYRAQLAEAICQAILQRLSAAAPVTHAVAAGIGGYGGGHSLGYTSNPILGRSRALDHVPGHVMPEYQSASNLADRIRILMDWLSRGMRFTMGIDNPTVFPHSAICQLNVRNTDGSGGMGSGFYIAPNRILTVGHNLALGSRRVASIEVFPGKANNMSTFGSFRVSGAGNFVCHPSFNPSAAVNDNFADFDLGVIKVTQPPPDSYFEIEELRMSPSSGVVVCGYAAEGVDPNQQHMDVDTIRDLNADNFTYALQIRRGSSGAPAYYTDGASVIAVGIQSTTAGRTVNRGCRLTDAKVNWIRSV